MAYEHDYMQTTTYTHAQRQKHRHTSRHGHSHTRERACARTRLHAHTRRRAHAPIRTHASTHTSPHTRAHTVLSSPGPFQNELGLYAMPLHAKDKKHDPALPSKVWFLACIAKAARKAASWQLPPDCCEALAPRAAYRFCQAIDMSHRRHARRESTIPQAPTICRNSHRPEFPLPSVVSRRRLRLARTMQSVRRDNNV